MCDCLTINFKIKLRSYKNKFQTHSKKYQKICIDVLDMNKTVFTCKKYPTEGYDHSILRSASEVIRLATSPLLKRSYDFYRPFLVFFTVIIGDVPDLKDVIIVL